jgi:excisionase family DNA binding protein
MRLVVSAGRPVPGPGKELGMLQGHGDEHGDAQPRLKPFYVSVKDAARLLGLGIVTIYRLVAAGKLVAVKAGRKTLVSTESLEAYAASLPRFVGKTGRAG